MGELTITTFLSLDGVYQAPGGPGEDPSGDFAHGGWMFPFADEDFGKIVDHNFGRVSAFLLGRVTYDIFAGYWPKQTDPNYLIANKLNTLPKYVASRTRDEFDWQNTFLITDPVNQVGELKERFEGEVQIHGSGGLARDLIAHDLIDEYRLFTFPVILGQGKRLFGEGMPASTLELVHSQVSSKGAVYSVYRRGGALQTGTFE